MKNLKDMSIDNRLKKLMHNESNAPDKAKMDKIHQLVLSQTESSSTTSDFFSFKILAVGGLATILLAVILFSQTTIIPSNELPSNEATLSETGNAILALTENDESMQNMLVVLNDFTKSGNIGNSGQEYDEQTVNGISVLDSSDFSSPYENLF